MKKTCELRLTPQIENIVDDFLSETNKYIKKNLKSISCSELYLMYKTLSKALKKYRGNSSNFTGYSEYIIFRSILHSIGGGFEPIKQQGASTYEFFNKDKNLIISGGIKDSKLRPDVVIRKGDKILHVTEIKLYPTSGSKTIKETFNKLHGIHNEHKSITGMIIVFSDKGKELLHNYEIKNRWFNYISLRNNENIFCDDFMLKSKMGKISKK